MKLSPHSLILHRKHIHRQNAALVERIANPPNLHGENGDFQLPFFSAAKPSTSQLAKGIFSTPCQVYQK
jgi:hypothetical protein